jgi:ribosome maturation factor RimP
VTDEINTKPPPMTPVEGRLAMGPIEDRVLALCEPTINSLGYECVFIEYVNEEGRKVLRFYIDQDGGVTINDCTKVSRQLNVVLDVDDIVPCAYTLQVSSPGIDRPLGRLCDFAAQVGETIRIEARELVEGRRRWTGQLKELDGSDIVVLVDGQIHRVPFGKIKRAKLKYEFGSEGKKSA